MVVISVGGLLLSCIVFIFFASLFVGIIWVLLGWHGELRLLFGHDLLRWGDFRGHLLIPSVLNLNFLFQRRLSHSDGRNHLSHWLY